MILSAIRESKLSLRRSTNPCNARMNGRAVTAGRRGLNCTGTSNAFGATTRAPPSRHCPKEPRLTDTTTVDTAPNVSDAQVQVAPTPTSGDPQGSTPAPVDTTASEPAADAGETPEQKQTRRASREFA